jgi:carbonic anhydrase/acetyltransferase-like protein (isoleucine patch superfamily)
MSQSILTHSEQLITCHGASPKLGKNVFLARGAYLVGEVHVGDESSIWFNAVLRGDVTPIKIGVRTNVQDGAVIHGTYQKASVTIGSDVTIGHTAILHGCTIGDLVLIGMGSIIMDLARVGSKSIVGAGSLITEGSEFPDGSLILGRPAKLIRPLKPEELAFLPKSSENYMLYKTWY